MAARSSTIQLFGLGEGNERPATRCLSLPRAVDSMAEALAAAALPRASARRSPPERARAGALPTGRHTNLFAQPAEGSSAWRSR